MALGRLFHFAFDAVLLSTLAAGVRRSSGFAPNTDTISEPNLRSAAERYLARRQGTTVIVNTQSFRMHLISTDRVHYRAQI
ncbi:Inositol polyphosphate phosphatase [Mycena chlorophos]|uniref:Inositol polyphosphate phosphatase n=1 Tax=Mycena chlorophos TaxID=658473 RepID=A0A8H6TFX7_MYCCL|nr:Inositol polyphosphate phosphatase [Mycena chlorophos]